MVRRPVLAPINQDHVVGRLRFENQWWITGSIDSEYNDMPRREYFELFYPIAAETDVRRAVVLMGPRRVGKTVMMHHAIQRLIQNGVNSQKICLISVDNPLYLNLGLEQLFSMARAAAGNPDPKGWWVMFDEIQYLRNWEIHLKSLVDSYPNTKFIVSGSASAALKFKSIESGAGRFTEFMLPSLTFYEYIHLKKVDNLMRPSSANWKGNLSEYYTTINIGELNKHFMDYLNFGGYPEVIFSSVIQANPTRYLRNDIIDKVLLRDLPSIYGIKDVQELNAFFTALVYYTGNEVSLESLSMSSGVDKGLLKRYLEYFEAAFLVKIVHRIDDNAKKFKRATGFKVYLTNPSLRSALFSPLDPTDPQIGSMVETAIFAQLFQKPDFRPWYARWSSGRNQGEVDLIGLDNRTLKPNWALEIKWSNRYYNNPSHLKSLLRFCSTNKLDSALVTSIDLEGVQTHQGLRIHCVPAATYAYSIGKVL